MTPIEGHAHLPSEIKKINHFDRNTANISSYFFLQDEVWIRLKVDQMAVQFVSYGLNHESYILIDYWREPLYAQTSQIRM
jgi:hypothetical protein